MFPSDRFPRAEEYAAMLASDGVVRGLIGPREAPRLWDRHLVNCAVLGEAVPADVRVCDLGSGAGLPGLVLAIARPDVSVTLVEPLLRRVTFLEEAVERLALDNVAVVRARAEDLHGADRFDVVTSRAVAPLHRLLHWSMPLVAPEGALVAMKGASAAEELREAAPVLSELGCAEPVVSEVGVGIAATPTGVVRVAWADPTRVRWPLAPGGPARSSRGKGRRSSSRQQRRKQGA